MSLSLTDPPLTFTAAEVDMLGRTADALTAYMGKPVLAEVVDAEETGFEWVLFAVPLENDDNADELVTVQLGGNDGRIIGNSGGLKISSQDTYNCQYLWAIQLSDIEGVRFIKLDHEGEEVAWSDDLASMLPFALNEVEPLADDPALDDEDTPDNEDEN